jgi:hypothetical protein
LIFDVHLLYPLVSPEFHSFSIGFTHSVLSNPFAFTAKTISYFAAASYNSHKMVISNLYSIDTLVIFIAHSNHIFEPAGSDISFSFISCLQLQVTCLSFQCFELVDLHLMSNYYYYHVLITFSSKTLIFLHSSYSHLPFSKVFVPATLYL